MVEIGVTKYNMRREMKMYHQKQEEEIEKQKDMLRELRPGIFPLFFLW